MLAEFYENWKSNCKNYERENNANKTKIGKVIRKTMNEKNNKVNLQYTEVMKMVAGVDPFNVGNWLHFIVSIS